MEYYRAERKKESLPFMTAWMELENIIVGGNAEKIIGQLHMPSTLDIHILYICNALTEKKCKNTSPRSMHAHTVYCLCDFTIRLSSLT